MIMMRMMLTNVTILIAHFAIPQENMMTNTIRFRFGCTGAAVFINGRWQRVKNDEETKTFLTMLNNVTRDYREKV